MIVMAKQKAFNTIWVRVLCAAFAFSLLYLLMLQLVFAQSSNSLEALQGKQQNQQQKDARVDSLSLEITELKTKLDAQLRGSEMRLEAMAEAIDRSFWIFVVLGTIGSLIGGFFVFRETQHHKYYLREREFYEKRAERYERRSEAIHTQILQLYQNQLSTSEGIIERTGKLFNLLLMEVEFLEKIKPVHKESTVLAPEIANESGNGTKSPIDHTNDSKVAQSTQQARERYAMLIDKKFQKSLTQEDQIELESLASLLDKAERPFYETIIQRLVFERDRLLKDLTKERRKVG
jgi:hypothetical protein